MSQEEANNVMIATEKSKCLFLKYFSGLMVKLCAQLFNIIFENEGQYTEQFAFYGKMQEDFALSLCRT